MLAKYRYFLENRQKRTVYSVGKIKNVDVTADVSHCFIVLVRFNPLNAELNPICHFLALLRAHPVLHVGRVMVKGNVVDLSKTVIVWILPVRASSHNSNKSTNYMQEFPEFIS